MPRGSKFPQHWLPNSIQLAEVPHIDGTRRSESGPLLAVAGSTGYAHTFTGAIAQKIGRFESR